MTPAAAYIRVSNALLAKDDRYGLARQRAEVEAYARREGLTLGEVYSDVITGKVEGRKDLSRLLANAGQYQAVIAPSVDRIGRTVLTAYKVLEELRSAGLTVHTAQDGVFDPESDSDALTYGMRALFSEQEHRMIRRRMLGGKLARAEKGGLIPHGWRCYGYRTVWEVVAGKPTRAIVVDQAEAAIVREVFRRLARGETTGVIADDLNRRGVASAMNARWHAQRIWYMARNRTYLGTVTMQLRHAEREFTFEVESLIDENTWKLAQGSLKRRPRRHLAEFVLHGILKCSECGAAMSGSNTGPERRYSHYRCTRAWKHQFYGEARCGHKKHHRARDLHTLAETVMARVLAAPEAYVAQETGVNAAEVSRLSVEIARAEKDLERYRADYRRGLLTGEEYAPLRDETTARLADLRAELASLGEAKPVDPRPAIDRVLALRGRDLSLRDQLLLSGTTLRIDQNGEMTAEVRL